MIADEDKRDNYRNRDNENAENNDNFIMLPTVDVCFKGLMYNPKVRKGRRSTWRCRRTPSGSGTPDPCFI